MCVCVCQTETRSRAGKIHPQRKNRSTAEIPAAFGRLFHYSHTLYSLSIYTCTVCDWKHRGRPSSLEVNGLYIPMLPPFYIFTSVTLCCHLSKEGRRIPVVPPLLERLITEPVLLHCAERDPREHSL